MVWGLGFHPFTLNPKPQAPNRVKVQQFTASGLVFGVLASSFKVHLKGSSSRV